MLSNWCGNNILTNCPSDCHDSILNTGFGEYQQWWIACRPRHPFLLAVINKCLSNIKEYFYDEKDYTTYGKFGVLKLTGPICYTQAITPILKQNSYRFKHISFDNVFIYMNPVYDHNNEPTHYSKLQTPIIIRE